MINDLINQQPGSHISFASPSNEHKVNSTKLYKGDFHLERLINLAIDVNLWTMRRLNFASKHPRGEGGTAYPPSLLGKST